MNQRIYFSEKGHDYFSMVFYGLSDVGMRRQNNQDSFGYLKIAENAEVYIVCDGMGGAKGGNIASEMAVRAFTSYIGNALGEFIDRDTGRLVLPDDSDSLGLYAETVEFDIHSGNVYGNYEAVSDTEVTSEKDISDAAEEYSDCADSVNEPGGSGTDGEDVREGCDESAEESDITPLERLMKDAANAANLEVYEASQNDSELSGMGTTLVAALTVDDCVFIAGIGDSRIYYFSGNEMTQLTHDHSYVQYLVDIGQITPEEARTNPYRNIITRAVGNESSVEADTAVLHVTEKPSYLLLCSDGLTGYVDESDICDTVLGGSFDLQNEEEAEAELREKVEHLIDAANENGGGDNITAFLVKFGRMI